MYDFRSARQTFADMVHEMKRLRPGKQKVSFAFSVSANSWSRVVLPPCPGPVTTRTGNMVDISAVVSSVARLM